MKVLKTPLGKSYWNEDSPNTPLWQKLYDELVPASGEAETLHGELIRVGSRFFYDFCNNGNCNILDNETYTEECWTCDGSGYETFGDDEEECESCYGSGESDEYDGDVFITSYYTPMLDLLKDKFLFSLGETTNVVKLEEFLLDRSKGYGKYKFDDVEMDVYNAVLDDILRIVTTTENEKFLGY